MTSSLSHVFEFFFVPQVFSFLLSGNGPGCDALTSLISKARLAYSVAGLTFAEGHARRIGDAKGSTSKMDESVSIVTVALHSIIKTVRLLGPDLASARFARLSVVPQLTACQHDCFVRLFALLQGRSPDHLSSPHVLASLLILIPNPAICPHLHPPRAAPLLYPGIRPRPGRMGVLGGGKIRIRRYSVSPGHKR